MSEITIPPEVVEAAARAVHDIDRKIVGYDECPPWEELSPRDQRWRTHRALATIRAALAAWPGTKIGSEDFYDDVPGMLCLPITENTDAEG